ncbi:bifunctional 3-deoxy-7-phosphoheptulonate synthase/chorismate mutase [Tuberibacillus calidus]|jgi:3-deoxy-7-phosphoheptulonate synthase/chorismate mutase|uniref:bifunctional 3-deoxy-7-phosphoheptulonate synthase/chorismate mutase n=1 Tax=Tuberibacillus calidus TaxID=340097 RepID=UPI0004200518|nr:bifunctional 3-deoxy-7-phosphoheptulonate synthase/chorismate mutase [Tuberibacillus calidus]
MRENELEQLRLRIDELNEQLLELINERARVVQQIGEIKKRQGTEPYDPVRERAILDRIIAKNNGPFKNDTLKHLFKEIFKASLELQEDDHRKGLLVSRKNKTSDTIIDINGETVGDGKQRLIAGPCAIESYEQTRKVAEQVKKHGVPFLRGGAFKPRTSPYDFQGLGVEGLKILRQVGDEFHLSVISEIMSPQDLDVAEQYLDIIQIGARNMQNFELLKAVGTSSKPVLLKRGLSATIDEFMKAAEYIYMAGNENVILCERGIRTFERATRNTLDISAVPILKKETHLPVFVDVTHATGRRDLLIPTAKAALAIGADGVMVEVHPDPSIALSDSAQQMDFDQFDSFIEAIKPYGLHTSVQESRLPR